MRLTRQLLFTLSLLSFLSAQAQKRSISLKEGLNLNFTGLADVELVVQCYTPFGNPSARSWNVGAVSLTVPTKGFWAADSFYASRPVATWQNDGDSLYCADINLKGWPRELALRLNEDSGTFRVLLPAALRFSAPVHQPVLDSNVLSPGTHFSWQPAPGADDPIFVEIQYDAPVVPGKRPRRSLAHRFFIPDNGQWTVSRRLLKGIPVGAVVSVLFSRGHFITFRSGLFRYEASVYESASTHFIRR